MEPFAPKPSTNGAAREWLCTRIVSPIIEEIRQALLSSLAENGIAHYAQAEAAAAVLVELAGHLPKEEESQLSSAVQQIAGQKDLWALAMSAIAKQMSDKQWITATWDNPVGKLIALQKLHAELQRRDLCGYPD